MTRTRSWSVGLVLLSGCLITASLLGPDSAIATGPPQNPAAPVTDLSGVTQSWDKNLPSASRFTVLSDFGGAAVRDNNTGLVWEQSPNATRRVWRSATGETFTGAPFYCASKTVGGTGGGGCPR